MDMQRLKDGTKTKFQYPEEIKLSESKLSEHATNITNIAQRYCYKTLMIYHKIIIHLFEIIYMFSDILDGDYLMSVYYRDIYISKRALFSKRLNEVHYCTVLTACEQISSELFQFQK